MMKCAYCGSELEADARFCTNCGHPVQTAQPTPQPQQPTPQPQQPTQPTGAPRPQAAPGGKKKGNGAMIAILIVAGLLMMAVVAMVVVRLGLPFLSKLKEGRGQEDPSNATAAPEISAQVETQAPGEDPLQTQQGGAEGTAGEPVEPSDDDEITIFDYAPYCGAYARASDPAEYQTNGGPLVELSMDGSDLVYTFRRRQSDSGWEAMVSGRERMDGRSRLSFARVDDGWGNLVTGYILLLENGNVEVKSEVVEKAADMTWALQTRATELVRCDMPGVGVGPGDYLWPTDRETITFDDLDGFTREEVVLIRNEVFARYGYSFKADNLRTYFAGKTWYRENTNVNANTFGTANMTQLERDNVDTIMAYERSRGWK